MTVSREGKENKFYFQRLPRTKILFLWYLANITKNICALAVQKELMSASHIKDRTVQELHV